MKLKHLLLFFSILATALVFQTVKSHSVFAAACPAGSQTLSYWDAKGFSSINGTDGPFLSPDSPSISHIRGGSTITINVGYNSECPNTSSRPGIFTWVNIADGGNPLSNIISSMNAVGGIHSDKMCLDEVVADGSPFTDPFPGWVNDPVGGKYFCDNEGTPIPRNSTAPDDPVGYMDCFPDPPNDQSQCSRPSQPSPGIGGGGGFAAWYIPSENTFWNSHIYNLQITTKNPATTQYFCMHAHVSITNDNPGGAYTDNPSYNNLLHLGKYDLPYDVGVAGTNDPSAPKGGVQCYAIDHYTPPPADIAPSFAFSADCHILYIQNLDDPNARSDIHFFAAIYHVNADGSRGPLAGKADGRGIGTLAWDYRDPTHPPPNQVPLEAVNDNYGWSIDLGVTNVRQDGTDGPGPFPPSVQDPSTGFGWVKTVNTGTCYTAACQNITIDRGLLGGTTNGVIAGSTFTVTAHFLNTQPAGSTDYLPAVLSDGANHSLGATIYHDPPWTSPGGALPTPYTGPDVPVGQPFSVSVTLTAPNGFTVNDLTMYADYWGLFSIDQSACTIQIKTYQPFHLDTNTPVTLLPTIENPSTVQYQAWVSNDKLTDGTTTSQNVYSPTSSIFYKIISGARTNIASGPPGGTYPAPSNTYYLGSVATPASYIIPHPPPNHAGDTYCSEIDIGYTDGYVGPGSKASGYAGQDDPTDVAQTSGGGAKNTCPKVVNEPYFKVLNSSVSTGSGFTGASACDGGEIASWNNDSGVYPVPGNFGAGSQLNALAKDNIVGFASNQNLLPSFSGTPATKLSFSNTNNVTGGTTDSPNMGGQFGKTTCMTPLQPDPTIPTLPSPGVVNIDSMNGVYNYNGGGNLEIDSPGTLNIGHNVTIYVAGDVYIHDPITYGNDGSWTPTTVPSFTLVATGNIYIDPGVGELDGTYIAQPSSSVVDSGGKVYTCSDTSNHFTFMNQSNLLAGCNKQLVVYGSFQANQVDLMRTFGSLRDEAPVLPPSAPPPPGSVTLNKNGADYDPGSCNPIPPDTYACANNGTSVYSKQNYAAKYTFTPLVAASGSQLTINYSNLTDPSDAWPPPAGLYSYDVEVDVNGVQVGSDLSLPTSGSSYTFSLGALPANPSITIKWKNNQFIPGPGVNGVFDPNFQIDSLQLTASPIVPPPPGLTPPVLKPDGSSCSNWPGSVKVPQTCAAEVFILSPEIDLGNIGGGPTPPLLTPTIITSLPPVL